MTLKQWTAQHETVQSVSTRQEALWMLISYSICDKTALNALIYLQLPPDSLSSCLTDAFSNNLAGKEGGGGSLVSWCWNTVVACVAIEWGVEGGWWWGWKRGWGAGNNWAKQNKEGTENNLKLCIDPVLVIVHIFHSPTGPISVSLKCKRRRKENEKEEKKADSARQRLATHTVGGNVPYIEVYWSCSVPACPPFLWRATKHTNTQTHTGAQSGAGGGHDWYAWQ